MSSLEEIPIEIRTQYEILEVKPYEEKTLFVFKNKHRKYGVLEKQSNGFKQLVRPIYESIGYEEIKKVIVALNRNHNEPGPAKRKYDLYNLQGELIQKFLNVDSLQFDKKGNVLIARNKKYALLNDDFELSFDFQYAKLRAMGEGFFKAEEYDLDPENYSIQNYKFNGIIDAKNKVYASFERDVEIFPFASEHHIIIKVDHRYLGEPIQYFTYHLYNKKQEQLPYEEIIAKSAPLQGLSYRTLIDIKENNHRHQSYSSNIDFEPSIDHFIGKWGLINLDGEVLIPNTYDFMEELSASFFKVAIGRLELQYFEEENELIAEGFKFGIIDPSNNIISPIVYNWIWKDIDQDKIYGNKGGVLTFDFKEHSADWKIFGGVNEEIKL